MTYRIKFDACFNISDFNNLFPIYLWPLTAGVKRLPRRRWWNWTSSNVHGWWRIRNKVVGVVFWPPATKMIFKTVSDPFDMGGITNYVLLRFHLSHHMQPLVVWQKLGEIRNWYFFQRPMKYMKYMERPMKYCILSPASRDQCSHSLVVQISSHKLQKSSRDDQISCENVQIVFWKLKVSTYSSKKLI